MVQLELIPKPKLTQEVEDYILERAGEIPFVQQQLRVLAETKGFTDRKAFHAFLGETPGIGRGGEPEALMHKLYGPIA